jgi:3-oxoacyl-[acyl-carrier-protein] synthase-3
MPQTRTVITGTGSYIPPHIKTNSEFALQEFYSEDNERIVAPPNEIAEKFRDITGIEERRYADKDINTSDMATAAARKAIEDAKLDPETLDQIIVAHNFGNIRANTIQIDVLPAISSRVKQALGIRNPNCVAYDILFGCPGWIQGVIQADAYIKAGIAQKCLVIGAETLAA